MTTADFASECAGLTGLLDQSVLQGPLSQLSQVLNAILALVPARPTG